MVATGRAQPVLVDVWSGMVKIDIPAVDVWSGMVKIDIPADPDEKPSGKRPEVTDVVVRSAMEDAGRDPNVLTGRLGAKEVVPAGTVAAAEEVVAMKEEGNEL
jgi:hypothetical protein